MIIFLPVIIQRCVCVCESKFLFVSFSAQVTCQHPPVYTKGPLKQMHSAPSDGLPRDPHGSSPDLHLAQRTLQDLQRFRVLQQMVEAQAHLQAQHGAAALYQNSQRVPLQSGTPHQNLRHSPPIIPVSRRYASSSQPPLNRHPIVGVIPSTNQRRSPPVLQRGSPPHPQQLQQQAQQQQPQQQSQPTNHCLYHNSSSPDCLALLFGNGVAVNSQLPVAPQSLVRSPSSNRLSRHRTARMNFPRKIEVSFLPGCTVPADIDSTHDVLRGQFWSHPELDSSS